MSAIELEANTPEAPRPIVECAAASAVALARELSCLSWAPEIGSCAILLLAAEVAAEVAVAVAAPRATEEKVRAAATIRAAAWGEELAAFTTVAAAATAVLIAESASVPLLPLGPLPRTEATPRSATSDLDPRASPRADLP